MAGAHADGARYQLQRCYQGDRLVLELRVDHGVGCLPLQERLGREPGTFPSADVQSPLQGWLRIRMQCIGSTPRHMKAY